MRELKNGGDASAFASYEGNGLANTDKMGCSSRMAARCVAECLDFGFRSCTGAECTLLGPDAAMAAALGIGVNDALVPARLLDTLLRVLLVAEALLDLSLCVKCKASLDALSTAVNACGMAPVNAPCCASLVPPKPPSEETLELSPVGDSCIGVSRSDRTSRLIEPLELPRVDERRDCVDALHDAGDTDPLNEQPSDGVSTACRLWGEPGCALIASMEVDWAAGSKV